MSEWIRRTPATTAIIAAILAGFILEVNKGALENPQELIRMGAIVREWIVNESEYWRLLSAMFLHGSPLHLMVNLIGIYQLGRLYELMFGTRRFTIIYFVTGLIASVTSMFVGAGASVGASGAIFGIMGAFILSIRRSPRWRHERVARSIVSQLIFWVVANIVISVMVPEIDLAAHIGGLVAGLIMGAAWPHRVPPPPPNQLVVDVRPYEGPDGDPRDQRNGR